MTKRSVSVSTTTAAARPRLAARESWFKAKYPNIKAYYDRHGEPRYYLRRKGLAAEKLTPFETDHVAFENEYKRLTSAGGTVDLQGALPGTVGALFIAFKASSAYPTGTESGKKFDRILGKFHKAHGDKPARTLDTPTVVRFRDETADNAPTVAKEFLWAGRVMYQWGIEQGMYGLQINPFIGVKPPKGRNKKGHHTWEDSEINHALDAWPDGTKERLVMALALLAGFRISDIIRVGRADIRARRTGEVFEWYWDFTQWKGRHGCPEQQGAPVHPELIRILKATPGCWDAIGRATFVRTKFRRPYVAEDELSKWFLERRKLINLRGGRLEGTNKRDPRSCSLHGLRKAAACALADTGSTDVQIAAFLGHADTSQVNKYIRERNKRRASEGAMLNLLAGTEHAPTAEQIAAASVVGIRWRTAA